ncbi:polyadenylate-binding protein 1-B-like [Galendromus occidentalis]|uniref:Polyadenylate-binding protein 1-B-like n=1 Tax=Galendromus occidentalis TaxID=34638 RepID=A0AAJ7P9N8_9ACAR|nr:polyadenylate-binding protein 1-B-like [Galendromus occidentalis]
MNLGIKRLAQVCFLLLLAASPSFPHKVVKLAAVAALLRGGPVIPVPIRYKVPQQTKIVHYPVRVPVHVPVHHHTQREVRVIHVPVHHYTHREQHHSHRPIHHHHVEVLHPQNYYHPQHYQPSMGQTVHRDDVYGGHDGAQDMGDGVNDGAYAYGGDIQYAY